MNNKPEEKWYFRTHILVIAFLSVGPFALPLVWFNPRFSKKTKIIISTVIIIPSYFLGCVLFNSLRSITNYYKIIFQGYSGW